MLKNISDYLKKENEDEFVKNFKSIYDEYGMIVFDIDKLLELIVKHNLLFSNMNYFSKVINDMDIICIIRKIYKFDDNYVISNLSIVLKYYTTSIFYIEFLKFGRERNINLDIIIKDMINNNIKLKSNTFLLVVMKYFQRPDLIFNNIDYFINNSYQLLDLKNIMKNSHFKKEYVDKLNKRIDENINSITYEVINSVVEFETLDKDIIIDFIKTIIKELVSYENINLHDIELFKKGAFSTVFKIGDKVLKIGRRREIFAQRNHRLFLKPLYRDEILDKNGVDLLFCIEITEFVDTTNITKEDVYKLYKELRLDGLIWTDCREFNVGRLIKDNKIYFDGINYVDKNSTGYYDDNDEVLKKGDLVIIDNDFIFEEDQFLSVCLMAPCENHYEFENRYINERSLTK